MDTRMIKRYRELLRRRIDNENCRRLTNKTFTLLSHNCNGGVIMHDLGLQFRTPTVNLFMNADDYLKFLDDLEHYLTCTSMEEVVDENVSYPVGLLDDIRLNFVHYPSFQDAKQRWFERCKRVDLSNLCIIFAQRDGCTNEHIRRFSRLPFERKVVFVAEPMPEIDCAFYDKSFPSNGHEVGILTEYVSRVSGRRYIDAFDYVSFFNRVQTI